MAEDQFRSLKSPAGELKAKLLKVGSESRNLPASCFGKSVVVARVVGAGCMLGSGTGEMTVGI